MSIQDKFTQDKSVLKTVSGDIISAFEQDAFSLIVVPVNTALRRNDKAIMGAGFAKEVRDYFSQVDSLDLEAELGQFITKSIADKLKPVEQVWFSQIAPVVYVPTKAHWKDDTDPLQLKRVLTLLNKMFSKVDTNKNGSPTSVLVPLMGGGNGNLSLIHI